jgi:hypothetical protein
MVFLHKKSSEKECFENKILFFGGNEKRGIKVNL